MILGRDVRELVGVSRAKPHDNPACAGLIFTACAQATPCPTCAPLAAPSPWPERTYATSGGARRCGRRLDMPAVGADPMRDGAGQCGAERLLTKNGDARRQAGGCRSSQGWSRRRDDPKQRERLVALARSPPRSRAVPAWPMRCPTAWLLARWSTRCATLVVQFNATCGATPTLNVSGVLFGTSGLSGAPGTAITAKRIA